jgi:hypothetical protein
MDPEIDELKGIVERQGKVIEETNRMVHGMRRAQRLRTLWGIVWWVAIFAVSGWAYLQYVQPYVDQVTKAYGSTKNFELQVQDWFAQFGHTTSH